jgi:Cu+-exporting ATPase
MHREITFADRAFGQESRSSLYLLTALIGLIVGADLWPFVAAWLQTRGVSLPTWPNEIGGFRVALVAAVLGGSRVLFGAFESLMRGRLGADLALAVACVAAILIQEPLVAAELVFVGLLGECLENFTFERTRNAVRKLADLTPRRCWRLRDGQEERVLVSDLQVGDHVVVKPGAKVPADGVVLAGRSALDTSALTGESLPVDRGPGDTVLAGSINQQGALNVEVRAVAEETVLGRVVQMTARALADRAPMERTADRLARYFLPAVLGLALLTFLVALGAHTWGSRDTPRPGFAASIRYAVYPALSVLVVACPCALILATPAAIIAALGRLAGTGILIKGGSVLERLAVVDTFAFDKTGTLTEGRLELGDVLSLSDIPSDEVLRLAACVEARSEHPLARVVLEAARNRGAALEDVNDFLAHTGSGVSGILGAGRVLVGNVRLLTEMGIALPDEARAALDRLDAEGQTSLLVCLDSRPVGVIGARDRVRPEARAVLDELRALGIGRLVMLTGDRPAAARAVAEAVGLSEVYAEQLPQDKAGRVAAWQGEVPPRRVALVGDGVNDAPALAVAGVGLAIGGTNDIAAEAGDIVLLVGPDMRPGETPRDPLRHLPFLLRLSRETVRLIRLNIVVFAFGVNFFGIALTAWLWPMFAPAGWYESGPIAAVVYHQLGSLLVLLNSMRLLWFERSPGTRRLAGRFRAVNTWLEKHLDLDEGLHWVMHRARAVAAGLLGVLVVLWAFSGFTAIASDEVGIVRRMGRTLDDDLTPGLHWRFPWPVDVVSRIRPERVRVVEVGFRILPGARVLPGGGWSSVHGGDGLARDADEAVMITGDNNLLEVQGSVRYTVDQPRVYLFEVAQPERTIRNAAESVLREVVAGRSMADLLTSDRARFQADVLARLEIRLRDGPPLGVRLEGVSLHDLHPPQEVVPAYHSVTSAMERRDRKVNQAQADQLTRRRGQQAKSEETVLQAAAERFGRIRMAEARRSEFASRRDARSTLAFADEMALFWQAYEARTLGESDESIRRTYREKRLDLLRRQEALTDFRVYWDGLTSALAGRPKVLIDADRLPGRRQLWLVPFDPPAAPALPPRRRPTDEP